MRRNPLIMKKYSRFMGVRMISADNELLEMSSEYIPTTGLLVNLEDRLTFISVNGFLICVISVRHVLNFIIVTRRIIANLTLKNIYLDSNLQRIQIVSTNLPFRDLFIKMNNDRCHLRDL